MSKSQYVNSLKFIDRVIKNKTEGVSHEGSMKQLDFPANCMNWNLGHLLVYREQILGRIDGETEADEAEFAMYGAGSKPLTDSEAAMPLSTLLTRLDDASARLIAAIEAMPSEKLDEVLDAERNITLRDRVNFYILFHEA